MSTHRIYHANRHFQQGAHDEHMDPTSCSCRAAQHAHHDPNAHSSTFCEDAFCPKKLEPFPSYDPELRHSAHPASLKLRWVQVSHGAPLISHSALHHSVHNGTQSDGDTPSARTWG